MIGCKSDKRIGARSRQSLEDFSNLDEYVKSEIGAEMVSGIADNLRDSVVQVLDTDVDSIATRVAQVEILLKTDREEMVLSSFESVPEAMRALTDLVSDRPDIRAFIQ